jgi:hypothetical protein
LQLSVLEIEINDAQIAAARQAIERSKMQAELADYAETMKKVRNMPKSELVFNHKKIRGDIAARAILAKTLRSHRKTRYNSNVLTWATAR